jgi:hypothetical protein
MALLEIISGLIAGSGIASFSIFLVMRGLDPRIHRLEKLLRRRMDCRVKPGNDNLLSQATAPDAFKFLIAVSS